MLVTKRPDFVGRSVKANGGPISKLNFSTSWFEFKVKYRKDHPPWSPPKKIGEKNSDFLPAESFPGTQINRIQFFFLKFALGYIVYMYVNLENKLSKAIFCYQTCVPTPKKKIGNKIPILKEKKYRK